MDISFDVSLVKGVKVITILGKKVNYENLNEMEEEIFREVEGEERNFILDLSQVVQIDSFALGFIMNLYRRVMEKGGILVLVSAHPRVRAVLGMARVDEVIKVYETKKEALDGLSK